MNIYLIASESYRLINEEVKHIVGDCPYTILNMNIVSLNEVLKEASYFSFFDEKKYILVTNANIFSTAKSSESDVERLTKYLEHPNTNTVLIFTANSIDSRKKIVKIIKDKYTLINIPKMDKKNMTDAVQNYFNKKDYFIDYNETQYIINNCYDNYDIVCNEMDKVMLYYNKPSKIKLNDLKNIIGESIENNNFRFVSAVIERKLEEAIKILKDLKINKVEPLTLIILLAREYRLMYYVKRYQVNKFSMQQICKELSLQDWQVRKLYNNGVNYTESELLKNIKMLADIDLGIKTGIMDKDIAINSFILEACE